MVEVIFSGVEQLLDEGEPGFMECLDISSASITSGDTGQLC